MPVASFTPRATSSTSTHRKTEAQMHDSRLLPPSKGWKKYPRAENNRMANETFERQAEIQ